MPESDSSGLRADGRVSCSASRSRGRIVAIDVLADPERLSQIDLAILDDPVG